MNNNFIPNFSNNIILENQDSLTHNINGQF